MRASSDFVGFVVGRTRTGFILGSGRSRSLGVSRVGFFFVARSDEIFTSPAGAVHPVHCLTRRDVAPYKGERRLTSLQWHQATSIEVRFRGHKGDQAQQGSVSYTHLTLPTIYSV